MVAITHWLPIVTFCPVNGLPDPLFITLRFTDNEFHELYAIRKQLRKAFAWKKMFMEDIAVKLSEMYPTAHIEVRLWFDKHEVQVAPGPMYYTQQRDANQP